MSVFYIDNLITGYRPTIKEPTDEWERSGPFCVDGVPTGVKKRQPEQKGPSMDGDVIIYSAKKGAQDR